MDAVTIFQSQISKVNFQVEKVSVETRVSRGFGEGINGNKLILKKKGLFPEKNKSFRRQLKHRFLGAKTQVSAGKRIASKKENTVLRENLRHIRDTKVSILEVQNGETKRFQTGRK